MAVNIVMPKLAMAMKQGKISEWKAGEGARVEKGSVVIIIETEKVTYEIEAPEAGFFHIAAELNVAIACNETIAMLAKTREELADLQAQTPSGASGPEAVPKDMKPAGTPSVAAPGGKTKISPAARQIAESAGIDINTLVGTGPGGRIVKEDVQMAIDAKASVPSAQAANPQGTGVAAEAPPGESIDGKRVRAMLPLKGIRAAVAEHMVRSLHTSAQLSTMGETDVTGLVEFRNLCVREAEDIGERIGYTDILVFILARLLKEQPIMNASLIDDKIVLWEDINIGVAVALPEEEYDSQLVVPVVRHADKMSLAEIHRAVSDIVKRGREKRLTLDDFEGGTFTLSNIGTLSPGYFYTTPVINQPQVAILGTGPIVKRPVVEDDQIVIRPILNYNLTFDHRVINGAPAAKFTNRLMKLLQRPDLLIL
ncbi:MAG: 2-oxo acid dehydrogenase subunit E2 [Desulfobacteraceae bacterium]|nr:2-oxo acid dehydrogenase subunit E2 [Desulfobacteraceae bacterium]